MLVIFVVSIRNVQEYDATRPKDPAHFDQILPRVLGMLDNMDTKNNVKRVVGIWQA
jgi:hypothetical protein